MYTNIFIPWLIKRICEMKNKHGSWFTAALAWWLSGLVNLHTQFFIKPFQRFKYPKQHSESVWQRIFRGGYHMAVGALWLLLIPFGYYMASTFIYEGAAIFGLAAAGYLMVSTRLGPLPAVIIGTLIATATALAAMQTLSFIVVPFVMIFGVKGMVEFAYGGVETLLGLSYFGHHWLTDYRDYITEKLGLRQMSSSKTIQHGIQEIQRLAVDANSTEANQAEIKRQMNAIQAKLTLRASRQQPSKIDLKEAKKCYDAVAPKLQGAPTMKENATGLLLKSLGISLVKMPSLSAPNWKQLQIAANQYASLFKTASDKCDEELKAKKEVLVKQGYSV